MGLFTNSKKTNLSANTSTGSTAKDVAFGSPLVKIGKGDLTKPYINSSGVGSDTYIHFGSDNRFPQLIDQMYYQSPLHSSIIDFQINSSIGGGFHIESFTNKTGTMIVEEKAFLKKIKAPKLLKGIALDLKMHKRVHLLVYKANQKVVKIERIHPAKVRYNKNQSKFWVSDNWLSFSDIKTYDEFDYAPSEKEEIQMYSYIDLESSPGQDIYPLDKTVSVFNWCYLDGQSANLQKDNIQRSIFGNIVIRRPNKFKNTEEFDVFKRGIETKEGEVVPVLLLSADGKDNLPEVESFPANQNDKAFEGMDKRIDDKICQAHSINPSIMGIERPGALGSGSDIKESYPIWVKNVVQPFREQIEEVMDDVLFLFSMKGTFKLNEFDIIDLDSIQDKKEIKTTK